MKKRTVHLLILTGVIFIFLAGLLLASQFAPGGNPDVHRFTMLVNTPTFLLVWAIGQLDLWPFSEQADTEAALLLGGLTLLTSFLYASALIAVINWIKSDPPE